MKMYYPEGNEYKIVFISSDSSSKEEDFEETSSTTSSTKNCSSTILDECDWDYFESGVLSFTEPTFQSSMDSSSFCRRGKFVSFSESSTPSEFREQMRQGAIGSDKEILMPFKNSTGTCSYDSNYKNNLLMKNKIKTKYFRHNKYLSGHSSSSSISLSKSRRANENSLPCSCGANRTTGVSILPQYVPIPVPVAIPVPISDFKNLNSNDLILSRNLENEMYNALQYLWKNPNTNLVQKQIHEQAVNALQLQQHQPNNYNSIKKKSPTQLKPNEPQYKSSEISNFSTKSLAETIKETKNRRDKENKSFLPVLYRTTNKKKKLSSATPVLFTDSFKNKNTFHHLDDFSTLHLNKQLENKQTTNALKNKHLYLSSSIMSVCSLSTSSTSIPSFSSPLSSSTNLNTTATPSVLMSHNDDICLDSNSSFDFTTPTTISSTSTTFASNISEFSSLYSNKTNSVQNETRTCTTEEYTPNTEINNNFSSSISLLQISQQNSFYKNINKFLPIRDYNIDKTTLFFADNNINTNENSSRKYNFNNNLKTTTNSNTKNSINVFVTDENKKKITDKQGKIWKFQLKNSIGERKPYKRGNCSNNNSSKKFNIKKSKSKNYSTCNNNKEKFNNNPKNNIKNLCLKTNKKNEDVETLSHNFSKMPNNTNDNNNLDIDVRPLANDKETIIKQLITSRNKQKKEILREKFKQKTKEGMITIGKSLKPSSHPTGNESECNDGGYLISENMFSSSSESETSIDYENKFCNDYDNKNFIKISTDLRKKSIKQSYDVASASGINKLIILNEDLSLTLKKNEDISHGNIPKLTRIRPCKDNPVSSSSSESEDTDDTDTIAERRPKSSKFFSKVFVVNQINNTLTDSDTLSSDASLESSCENDSETETECGIILNYVKSLSQENLRNISKDSDSSSIKNISNKKIDLIRNCNYNFGNLKNYDYIKGVYQNDIEMTAACSNEISVNNENHGIVLNSIRNLSFDNEYHINQVPKNSSNFNSVKNPFDNNTIKLNSVVDKIGYNETVRSDNSIKLINLNQSKDKEKCDNEKLNNIEINENFSKMFEDIKLNIKNNNLNSKEMSNYQKFEDKSFVCEKDNLEELNSITSDVDKLLKYNSQETEYLVEKLKKNVKEINEDLLLKPTKITSEESDSNSSTSNSDRSILTSTFAKFSNISLTLSNDEDEINIPLIDLNLKKNENKVSKPVTFKNKKTKSISNSKIRGKVIIGKEQNKSFLQKVQPSHKLQQSIFSSQSLSSLFPSFSFESKQENQKIFVPKTGLLEKQYKKQQQAMGILLLNKTQNIVDINSSNTKGNIVQPSPTNVNYKYIKNMLDDPTDQKCYFERSENIISQIEAIDSNKKITKNKAYTLDDNKKKQSTKTRVCSLNDEVLNKNYVVKQDFKEQQKEEKNYSSRKITNLELNEHNQILKFLHSNEDFETLNMTQVNKLQTNITLFKQPTNKIKISEIENTTTDNIKNDTNIIQKATAQITTSNKTNISYNTTNTMAMLRFKIPDVTTTSTGEVGNKSAVLSLNHENCSGNDKTTMLNKNEILKTTNTLYYSGNESYNKQITNNNENKNNTKYLTQHHQSNNNTEKFNVLTIGDIHIQTSNYKSNMNEKTNIPSDSIKQQQFSKGNTHTSLKHTFQIDNYLQKNIQTAVEYDHSYVSGESISVENQFTINNNLLFSSINKNESINNAKSLSSKYRSLVIINQDRSKYISGTSNSEIQIMEKELLRTPKIHIIHDTQSGAHFDVKDNDKINKSQITIRNNKSPNSNEISINFNHKNQNNELQNSSKKNSSSSNNNSDLNKMSNSAMMTSLYLNKKLNKNIPEKNKSLDSVTQKDNSEELLKSEFNLKKSLVEQQPVNHSPIQNNSKDTSRSFIFSTSSKICDSNDVTVITGPTTLTAAVCLEDGLADDDSWVEEISQDEEEIAGASTTATDSDIDSSEDILLSGLIDREEELRGYNRTAIDFTLHTIIEESCEEWSEVEQTNSSNRSSRSCSGKKSKTPRKQKMQQGSPSELEKYFVFGLGDGNIMTSIDTKEESSSEVSSICSEGLDSLIEPPINTNNDETNNAAQLACSRLEKYFLSGFMGYCQSERNESDESGSVGSDSEGKPSPSQRRKRLVRARGTPRSQNSSLDNLLAKDIENNDFSQCENQNDSHDSSESETCDNTVIHIEKGEHDTIKRKKQARKRHDSDEATRKSIENEEQFSDKNNDTLQQDFLISNCGSNLVQSKSQHSRDSGFVGSNDDLLKNDEWIRSPEIKIELEDIKEETKETDSSIFFRNLQHPNTSNKPPIHPQSLTRKDSFNNWSSDEETNLMMSKMRQFFKTLVAANANASSSKNSTPIVSATSTPKNLTPVARIKNRNKPAQLAYFESELTRLMKTVPGINDDQVREIVEYLSSEDTWSDSYDSSDYTSSDLEGVVNKKKNLVLKEQISASCQQIINKFDNPVNDREGDLGDGGLIEETNNSHSESALVYQKLVQSFSKITTGDENTKFLQENNNESTSSNQTNQRLINVAHSDKSPKLLAKVMHHIGTKLVALMHEVSSGDSRASNSPAPPQRYHKRINQKFLKKGDNDEDDDSLSDCSNDKINEFKHHTVQVQINNTKIPIKQTTTSMSISTPDAVALILPRSKSHDLLLSDARPQHHQSSSGVSDIAAEENVASDYERFSWRGSFESALLANGDSRTKLTLLDRDNSSSASALIAKRRSAGDLLFNQTRLSQEQLDRVRSCGSIDGSTVNDENELQTTKSWNTSINHHHNVNSNNNIEEHNIISNRRRSSVPDSICEYEGTSDEDNNSGDGSVNKTRSTLPRSLQNFQTTASNTNSLPRLPTTPLMPTASITKAQSVLHFLPNNIKSARYRPPGVNSNTRNNSITKKASSTSGLSQLLYSRRDGRRKFNIFGPNEEAAATKSSVDISNSTITVSKNIYSACNNPISTPGSASSDPWPSQSDEDIDRLVALHQNRNSLSSLGKRSDSMASVYSGAGDGRYGTVIVKGQVEFGMQYNYKQSALEIHVVRCKDLAAIDSKRNRSDPYVKVYLLPDKSKGGKRKTKVKKHTLNPVFDEVLRFHMPMSNLESRQLWLTVWHCDMFGRNDFLGEVIINLAGRLFDKPHPQWYLLQERSEPFDDISVYRGDIIVGLKFVPPENSISKNSLTRGSNSNLKKFGSIKGNSKNFSTKGQLHVLVKEAKNLTAIKPNGVCDAFCKSYLLPDRTRGSKQKTQIAKRTNNPVWNYTFVYEDVSLQELSERALELTIWDHDRLASNEFLGGVRFSLGTGKHYGKLLDWMDATGKELSLWQNMLNRPNFWVEGALILRSSLDGIKALP